MTRSFGDYVASTVGVISEPEVTYYEVTSGTILFIKMISLWLSHLTDSGNLFQMKKYLNL